MNFGFLYEIQRKSEELKSTEHQRRPSQTLTKTYSDEDDDEVWEVPEEHMDNPYQTIADSELPGNVEENTKQKSTDSPVNLKYEIFATQRLRVSLSAEQIALKAHPAPWESPHNPAATQPQLINKSINKDGDVKAIDNDNEKIGVTNSNNIKWKNIKINNKWQKEQLPQEIDGAKLWDLKLAPLKFNSKKLNRRTSNFETASGKTATFRKLSLGAALGLKSYEGQRACCSSPESLIDNILSQASSVSMQSSDAITNDERNIATKTSTQNAKSKEEDILNKQPMIMVTQASVTSTSAAIDTTPADTYETASNVSRTPHGHELEALAASELFTIPEDLLCAICNEMFMDPRCLACLHTFCFQCIVNETFKQESKNPFWPLPAATNLNANSKVSSSFREPSTSQHPKRESRTNDLLSALKQASPKNRSSFSLKLKRPTEPSSSSKLDSDSSDTLNDHGQSTSRCYHHQSPMHSVRKIICKLCQHVTIVPMGGVRQLPQNPLILEKLNNFRLKSKNSAVNCGLCYEETNASYCCETCSLKLCTLCKEAHMRQRTTALHSVRPIPEITEQKDDGYEDKTSKTEKKQRLKCSLHQGFEIKSFCCVCLQMVCTDCLVLQHKGHRHEPLVKAGQCYARLLRDATEQTRLTCKSSTQSLDKLQESSEMLNSHFDELRDKIECFMRDYVEAVEAHKLVLLRQIDKARESKLGTISKQQTELENHNQEAMAAVTFSQGLLDNVSATDILPLVKFILKRFEHCQQFKRPLDAKLPKTPKFVPNIQAAPCKEYKDIPVFGIITTKTVEPSQCTLQWDGFSQLRINKKVILTLISRDADGAPINHGGLKIQSHVKYRDLNAKCLRMEITDNNDGTYSIAFTPDSEGTIILMITIREKHIKGSPFSFLARPVRPHTGIYHCCSFCSSKGNKFATCSCEGHMPGYMGCGHGHTGHPGHRHWSCCGDVLRNSECRFANRSLNPK